MPSFLLPSTFVLCGDTTIGLAGNKIRSSKHRTRTEMKVLFIPCAMGSVLPHLFPLIALEKQLRGNRWETAFLVSNGLRNGLQRVGINTLDFAYKNSLFRTEMQAIASFKPDVVVDDLSPVSLLTTQLQRVPRVSIRRTGTLPNTSPRMVTHRHSVDGGMRAADFIGQFYLNSELIFGIPAPKTIHDLCNAVISIIPGIATIEQIAEDSTCVQKCVYAGSLAVPDSLVFDVVGQSLDVVRRTLHQFFEANDSRKIAYVTLGTTQKADDFMYSIVDRLLGAGYAVVSSFPLPPGMVPAPSAFLQASLLPMDEMCAKADLMVHHCGSGTYHYAIKHEKPSICIGSGCYDRDDVAMRLEDLNVARYVPRDGGDEQALRIFSSALMQYTDEGNGWLTQAKGLLRQLKVEEQTAKLKFNLEALLETAASVPI